MSIWSRNSIPFALRWWNDKQCECCRWIQLLHQTLKFILSFSSHLTTHFLDFMVKRNPLIPMRTSSKVTLQRAQLNEHSVRILFRSILSTIFNYFDCEHRRWRYAAFSLFVVYFECVSNILSNILGVLLGAFRVMRPFSITALIRCSCLMNKQFQLVSWNLR